MRPGPGLDSRAASCNVFCTAAGADGCFLLTVCGCVADSHLSYGCGLPGLSARAVEECLPSMRDWESLMEDNHVWQKAKLTLQTCTYDMMKLPSGCAPAPSSTRHGHIWLGGLGLHIWT